MPRVFGAPWALFLSVALSLGCVSSTAPSPPPAVAEGPIVPADVSDTTFASEVHALLRDGTPSPARTSRLVGTVRRQLAHAAERFEAGHDVRAAETFHGAFALVRQGEGRADMIDAAGQKAIAAMLERTSARGDEGRTEALLRMRRASLDPTSHELVEVDEHLANLARWRAETHAKETLEGIASDADTAVARALVDTSEAASQAAVAGVERWIDGSLERLTQIVDSGERPEASDVYAIERARQTAGVVLASLFLRHGDAEGALRRISEGPGRAVVRPTFASRIVEAADGGDAKAWRSLSIALLRREYAEPRDSFAPDEDLLTQAIFGTAVEAYRRDPTDAESATLVARLLLDLGLPEAAPLVLADAAENAPRADVVNRALTVTALALTERAEDEDVAAVRAIYGAAARLLAVATSPALRGRVSPAPADLMRIVARVEVRAGNLKEARPLLTSLAAAQPSASSFTELAQVERQLGDAEAALGSLARAASAPDASVSPLDITAGHLLAFEIHRDAGHEGPAADARDRALTTVLGARNTRAPGPFLAETERLLGRVLDTYGDRRGAARALERALTLSEGDRARLGSTMLAAIGSAFTHRDVASARAALRRGIEADAPSEDLLYGGLWVHLLEKSLAVPPDGTAQRAIEGVAGGRTWPAKLAAWANGRLSNAELDQQASSPAERVEAKFYVALAARGAGDAMSETALREVASSPVVDLIEVQLARDLTAQEVRGAPPATARLP